MKSSQAQHGRRRLFFVLFLISGLTGVVFEVVSSKLLGLLMGNSIYSITTVVTAFMAGLALGSWYADRLVRGAKPLAVYGTLEACVGLFCLAFPWLLDLAHPLLQLSYDPLKDSFYLLSLLRFFVAFSLLMIPTTLMGATLPVLAAGLSRGETTLCATVGQLYAVNSLGAVLGALASSFFLLPVFGISTTLKIIALADLTIALLAHRAARLSETAATKDETLLVERATAAGQSRRSGSSGLIILALGFAGFAAMALEIAWTRSLILVLGSSTYAFSMILASFIAGISVGSFVATRLESVEISAGKLLVFLTMGVSVTGLLTLPLLGQLPLVLVDILVDFSQQWTILQAMELFLIGVVILVPATLMGACFPTAIRLAGEEKEGLTRTIGRLYGANTVGNILGSFSAGMLLIPALGIQRTIWVASLIEGATSAMLALLLLPDPRWTRIRFASVALVAPISLCLCLPGWDRLVMNSGTYLYAGCYAREARSNQTDYRRAMHRAGRVIFNKEGVSATVSILEDPAGDRGLIVNGKTDASSVADMKTQRLVGHLPMLLHPDPKDALVIGLGAGVTLSSVLGHPAKRIDLVEISPEIVEASRYFMRENRDCLSDPRVHLTITDARNHLALSARKYDVIASEPTNPWISGVASLFTREFFQLLRDRLNPGGVVSQWVQAYSTSTEDFKAVIGTFRSVFPFTTLWRSTEGTDYILVGSNHRLLPDCEQLARRFAVSKIRTDLVEVGVEDPLDLMSHFLATPKTLDPFVAGSETLTDDTLRLEFTAPRNLYIKDGPSQGIAEATQEDLVSYLPHVKPEEAKQMSLTLTARRKLSSALDHLKGGRIEQAQNALREAKKLAPLERGSAKLVQAVYLGMTTVLEKSGRSEEALAWLKQIGQTHRDDPDLMNEIGNLCGTNGRHKDAEQHFLQALAKDPNHLGARKNLALVYYQTGRFTEAIREYEKVVAMSPYESKMHNNLGILYEKVHQPEKARRSWTLALRADPAFDTARRNLESLEAKM